MVEFEEESAQLKALSINHDLLNLYDEISAFNDCCAFLCDAFASLAAEEEALDTSTIEGLKCLSHWMKQRMAEVKRQIKEIQEKFCSETKEAP